MNPFLKKFQAFFKICENFDFSPPFKWEISGNIGTWHNNRLEWKETEETILTFEINYNNISTVINTIFGKRTTTSILCKT